MEDRGFCHREPLLCPAENASFTGQTEQGKEYLLQQTERWYKWEAFTNKKYF